MVGTGGFEPPTSCSQRRIGKNRQGLEHIQLFEILPKISLYIINRVTRIYWFKAIDGHFLAISGASLLRTATASFRWAWER